ncbi:hypothetical protein [Deinococcus maricopensis]|nr:hypothetical protein [Deinococcus maricopensis]
MQSTMAVLFAVTITFAVLFQLALAAGAPWGAYAMGGAHPGRFPAPLRVAALFQAALLSAMAGVVLARAGVGLPAWASGAPWLIWCVVAFSALSLGLNLITPSAVERRIWAPVALVLLASSVVVALGAR